MRGQRRHRRWFRRGRLRALRDRLRGRKQRAFELSKAQAAPEMPVEAQPAPPVPDEAYQALIQARQTATEIVQRAADEAEMILETARHQADTITFDARSLSQDFLDRLRDLRERAAHLELEDPPAIVRRLMASNASRPGALALGPSPGSPGPRNGDLTATAAMFWAERAGPARPEGEVTRGSSLMDDFWLPRSSPK